MPPVPSLGGAASAVGRAGATAPADGDDDGDGAAPAVTVLAQLRWLDEEVGLDWRATEKGAVIVTHVVADSPRAQAPAVALTAGAWLLSVGGMPVAGGKEGLRRVVTIRPAAGSATDAALLHAVAVPTVDVSEKETQYTGYKRRYY
eukprot:gene44944-52838_t